MSPKGFAGGYTLPGTKEWAEQMVKFTTDAQYNEIHPFIRNSVSKWIDYFSAESIQKAEIAPVSMNFKDWKMVDYIENFSLVLKLEGENLYLASLAQVFEKENLYKNSSKDIGVPESIEAVFFENSSISKRIIFNKLN